MVKNITYITAALILASCTNDYSGMIINSSIGVEQRFKESIAYNSEIVLTAPSDDYRIYVGADVHVQETANNLKQMITKERNDTKAVASLVLGDFVTNKGTMHIAKDAMRFDPDTQVQNDTVFTVVGNHDLYFNQWRDYKKHFNSSAYYFSIQTPNARDLYIILDSANGSLGRAQTEWLRELLSQKRSTYRHCIIGTHTNLFRNYIPLMMSGNFTLEETYDFLHLASSYGVDLVLQGHHHGKDELSYDNVDYVLVETIQDAESEAGYTIVNISDTVTCDFLKIQE